MQGGTHDEVAPRPATASVARLPQNQFLGQRLLSPRASGFFPAERKRTGLSLCSPRSNGKSLKNWARESRRLRQGPWGNCCSALSLYKHLVARAVIPDTEVREVRHKLVWENGRTRS